MKDLLETAISVTAAIARGKADKLGKPWIMHSMRVMSNLSLKTSDPIILSAGCMHDLVEDFPEAISFKALLDMGFPVRLINVLWHLTHHDGYSYPRYIEQVVSDKIACFVKEEDVRENMRRMVDYQTTEPATYDRLKAKYEKAFRLLVVLNDSTSYDEACRDSFEFIYELPFSLRRPPAFKA